MTYSIPYQIYEKLEEGIGKEKASIVSKGLEESIRFTIENNLIQLKYKILEELKEDLVAKRDLEILKKEMENIRMDAKKDIENLRAEMKKDIENLRTEMKKDIENLKMETKKDIENLRIETKKDIENLKMETKKDIENLRIETKKDIENLRIEMKKDIENLKIVIKKDQRLWFLIVIFTLIIVNSNSLDILSKILNFIK